MKKTALRKYARLIVRVGARVKKKQPVLIISTLDQPEFTTMVAEECYRAGASSVVVRWNHQPITRLDVKYQSDEELQKVAEWRVVRASNEADQLPVRINLRSVDPDGMKGVDTRKSLLRSRSVSAALKPYTMKREGQDEHCLAAVPNVAWAKKLFPHLRTSVAVDELWKLIFKATRCDGPDPVKEWEAHNADLQSRCNYLNSLGLSSIRYYASNGTDLTMGLIPQAKIIGGQKRSPKGNYYNANIPTEECFCTPHKDKTEGIVYGSLPWCWNGQIIEDYWLRFHEGKVVEFGAKKNVEFLEKMLSMDEGAPYLGEFALVPWESPINQTGVLFYDTLFDENACCHLALGRGFVITVPEHSKYSRQEMYDMGINDSVIHQDFMIGTADMNIDGTTEDGTIIPIFRNGTWAF